MAGVSVAGRSTDVPADDWPMLERQTFFQRDKREPRLERGEFLHCFYAIPNEPGIDGKA